MKHVFAAAVLAMLLFSPDSALACTCGGTATVCQSLEAADAVLIGTVMRVENRVAKSQDGREYIIGQTAHVQVDEAFKGVKSPEMIFRSYGSSCDAHYGAGQRWLFYAYHGIDDTWTIAPCDRSTQIDYAADDLLYLRALPQSAQKTRIAGQLRNRDYTPLIGVKVKLVGSFLTQEVFTDKNGVYEAYGLPAGKYLVQPETPPNLKLNYSSRAMITNARDRRWQEVELNEKSCAVINFSYTEDTLVSGRVFGADGEPLPNVCVHLLFKDKPKETPYLGDCTDENGRFKIDDIVLGEYLLVANEDGKVTSDEPFPTAYYPGVFEKQKATTLIFSSGDKFEGLDIHIPAQKRVRYIEGKLLFSDGRPACRESVKFVPEGMQDNLDAQSNAGVDTEGRFRLQVLEGLKGTVYGYMFAYSGEYENCPKLEAILKARQNVSTNSINVELNRDYQDLDLVFPFPKCKRVKE